MSQKIEDYGEKIGGAKKDLWKQRGLMVSDFKKMNDRESEKYVTKDNIWQKPDYMQLVQDGLDIKVAYFRKLVRDALPRKPVFSYYAITEEEKRAVVVRYIEFVWALKEAVEQCESKYDVRMFFNTFFVRNSYILSGGGRYYKVNDDYQGIINKKLLKVIDVDEYQYEHYSSEIRKKRFCYSETDKLIADYKVVYYEADKTEFKVLESGKVRMEMTVPGGVVYYYPKGTFAESKNWTDATYVLINNRDVVANNFESIAEAREFAINKEKAALAQQDNPENKKRKTKFVPEQLKLVTRIGPEYNGGRKITGQDYLNVFRVRGGEFGNWMTDKDRQASLDFGYDAFCDLADVLDIAIADISFNGKLAIAFGARGSGNARAHYEPDLKVINLTKLKGAGSLAHEWGHALDDYISEALGITTTKLFSETRLITEEQRSLLPEFSELLHNLKYKTILTEDGKEKTVKTDFLKGSIKFDSCHSKQENGYWQSRPEMFARAFDCYVSDKLKELNRRSDYLTAHANCYKTFDTDGSVIYAYPRGEERKQINESFDILFDALKNKRILHKKTTSTDRVLSEQKKEKDSISFPRQKTDYSSYNQLSLEDVFGSDFVVGKNKII